MSGNVLAIDQGTTSSRAIVFDSGQKPVGNAQREFENRVLFQMSQTDSSQVIETTAAGKLGTNRALLHSEYCRPV